MIDKSLRKTGLDIIGDLNWGTHLCVFYQRKEDLIDILIPYFKAGLENNELCMWITSEPLKVEEAKGLLEKAVKNLDDYIAKGQIEILDYSQWYTKSGEFEADKILQGWAEKEAHALKRGFDGLRVTGNAPWLEKTDWKKFADYEAVINNAIGKHRMLAICTYSLDKCSASEVVEVVLNHQFIIIRREGKWEFIENLERKHMKDMLQISDRKFKDIVENTSDWIWEIDKNGVYTYVSPKVKDLLGYEVNEVLGKTPFDFMPEEEAKKISEIFKEKVSKKGQCSRLENINRHKDGHLVFLETSCVPILDELGQLIGYRGIDRDITESKKAEKALKESQERYSKLVENLPVGVYRNTPGPQGHFIEANEAIIKMFEADSREEFLKHNVSDLYWDPSQRQEFSKKVLRQGFVKNEALELKTLKGNRMWCSLNTVAKQDKNGDFYFDGVIENITESKNMEEALKKSEEELCKDKLVLEQKNLALKEMIEHIERTKNRIKEDIAINVDEALMPIVEKLKRNGASPKYIKLLQYHLKELSSSFTRKITQKSVKLTSREIEICNMLRGGLSTKDLADLLSVSQQTIEKHRKNIRKKLGLSSKKANLIAYLQNI